MDSCVGNDRGDHNLDGGHLLYTISILRCIVSHHPVLKPRFFKYINVYSRPFVSSPETVKFHR